MPLLIRRTDAATILPLRHAVLRPGLPAESAVYPEDATTAVHWGAFGGDTLLGCVTIHPDPLDNVAAWRLRGMAVGDAARGTGVGRMLVDAVHAFVDADPPRRPLWCNARLPAVGFYERCGWDAVTGVYDIPGVGPHRKMVRRA